MPNIREQKAKVNARAGQGRLALPLVLQDELNRVQRALDVGRDIQAFAFPPAPRRIVVLLIRNRAGHMEFRGHCSLQGIANSQKSISSSSSSSGRSSSDGMPPDSPSSSNA